ncbi:flavin reductase family protein [Consotaella salsifontis]|uniref:NADH-FMN oxidoreductase RutF, flavin reductase (DIM6/NTAB) family n=1 Tax=Consotaella salsifontis TaxID=1365950 RepID=A0A1T4SG48_9HYPH|nr:flavin reductase family protein [Consotaella salsifontis]SKA27133.1 NADH-FMN oxidoreductase RutF, flavin reductase (DIM6/NTAB) family [Consotaella salsifontis]
MLLDFATLPATSRYKLLTATVLPRPIAWVTTLGEEGQVNAAPFSFFNVFSEEPALIILGLQHHPDGSPKDTTRNIHARGEFVVNIVSEELLPAMIGTAAAYPPGKSETAALGLAVEPGARIATPRIAAAPVALECRRHTTIAFGDHREILIGEVLALHAREGLIDPVTHRVEWDDDYPVGRLFADRYSRTRESDRHSIPPAPQEPGFSSHS